MVLPQPSIYLAGIRIDEPVTALTDLMVSAVCLGAYLQLSKREYNSRALRYFRYYFLLMAVATLLGGLVGHAFLYALSFSWKLPGWVVSMLSVALIERSSIEYARPLVPAQLARFFLILNIVELLTVMSITFYTLNFRWVEFHSGYGLLGVVLPFHLYRYHRTRDRGSLIVIVAVGIATLAAIVYMNRLALHTWFNHLDISHVLMAAGAYVFFLGARQLCQTESMPEMLNAKK
jgi:hypothetical protein